MEGEIFDWKPVLQNTTNFRAANVSWFNHVPGANNWNEFIVPGIKIVARHFDAEPSRRSLSLRPSYWVVTVMDVQGYFALVRYLGMGRDASQDFWIHMGLHEICPVGRESCNAIFMPPKFVQGRAQDWRTYFLAHLKDGATLPFNFIPSMQKALRASKYKVGDYLEVIDKYNISQFRVGRVSKIVGRRMHIRYVDDGDDGFFCHEQSSFVHSIGWATYVGHKIKMSEDGDQLDVHPLEKTCFSLESDIKQGMKLEAVDPLCPSQICAATVCKVLGFGYMMVKMDCYEYQDSSIKQERYNLNHIMELNNGHEHPEGDGVKCNNEIANTWFCYHIDSPNIFKCGFCKRYGIHITPPMGFKNGKFLWNEYFENFKKVAAPLPEKPKLKHGFKASMKLEMADLMNPTKIHPATIMYVAGRLLRISFDGWEPVYDQWMDAESPDIYPIGWSALVGHALETPKLTPESTETTNI